MVTLQKAVSRAFLIRIPVGHGQRDTLKCREDGNIGVASNLENWQQLLLYKKYNLYSPAENYLGNFQLEESIKYKW